MNMKKMPLISIIIPAYNAEGSIENTLSSIQIQSYAKDIEVIIIDDGSSDNTVFVVNDFMRSNNLKIKIFSQMNAGEGNARNKGIELSNGKYLLFLDSDDILIAGALKNLIYTSIKFDTDIIFGSYKKIFTHKKERNYFSGNALYNQAELIKYFFRRQITIGIGNTIIKSEVVTKNRIKFFDFKAGADNHFFRELLKYIDSGASISSFIFGYNITEGSVMTSRYNKSRLDSIYSVHDTKKSFLISNVHVDKIRYLDIFLINEVRGNAIDYLRSKNNPFSEGSIDFLKKHILNNMPTNTNLLIFFGMKRFFWLLSQLFFYISPKTFIFIYFNIYRRRGL